VATVVEEEATGKREREQGGREAAAKGVQGEGMELGFSVYILGPSFHRCFVP